MLGGERKGKTLHDFFAPEIDIFFLIDSGRRFGKTGRARVW